MAGCVIETRRIYSPTERQEELRDFLGSGEFNLVVNEVLLEVAKEKNYIPSKFGELRRNGKVQKNGVSYSLPYARYQYWGDIYVINFRMYEVDGKLYRPSSLPKKYYDVAKPVWRSKKGEGTKYNSGREIGSHRGSITDPKTGKSWELGYTTQGTKSRWLHRAYEENARSVSLKITNRLKKRLKGWQ